MTIYNFTDEELKYLMETLEIVLKDIDAIREISPLVRIEVDFKVDEDDVPWDLKIYKDGVCLESEMVLETMSTTKKRKKDTPEYHHHTTIEEWSTYGQNKILRFLSKYDEIRKMIIEEVQKNTESKENLIDQVRRLRTNFTQEVYVDFGESKTQNQQRLEIVEQDGKKIGTIDFGQKIVRVITEGDIVLTHTERAKEKLKAM